MSTLVAIWLAACLAQGQVLDRIAVSVDDRVITLSDVIAEVRLAALLDGAPVAITPETKRKAAERLVENLLLLRDMELTRFPLPSDEELEDFLAEIRQARKLDAAGWEAEVRRYQLEPARVREQLRQRLGVLRYIEFRFRPQAQLGEAELWQRGSSPAQATVSNPERMLEVTRQTAESALLAHRVDELVDAWLKDARQRARIRFREAAFQ